MSPIVLLFLLAALSPGQADSCYFPAWSPDGTTLAFEVRIGGEWRVATVGVDGTSLRMLTDAGANHRSPSWSANGRELAIVSDREGDWDLYTIATDGTKPRRLTRDPHRESAPAWSPDGRWIAFVRDDENGRELRVIDPEASRSERFRVGEVALGWRLSWSRDGRRLAWFSPEKPSEDGSATRLAIVSLAPSRGSGPLAVTLPSREPALRDFNPSWTGDGWVVFDAHEQGAWESDDGGWEIWTMREDGSERRRLTVNRVNDWGPAVSPDGRWIAFSSGMNDRYEIWVMNRDGSGRSRLTRLVYPGVAPGEIDDGGPGPSSDGRGSSAGRLEVSVLEGRRR